MSQDLAILLSPQDQEDLRDAIDEAIAHSNEHSVYEDDPTCDPNARDYLTRLRALKVRLGGVS